MKKILVRCWKTSNPLYIKYHDEEWGVPVYGDRKLFEFLVLESFQAGLTWELILNRRDSFRVAFDNFEPKIVATYSDEEVNRLLGNAKIIRNKLKIRSSINNACRVLEIQKEFGSFSDFIWSFVGGKTIYNKFKDLTYLPSQTKESVEMSKEMKRRGFKFVGPTICYAFMQAVGLVNDHVLDCFRYKQIIEDAIRQ
ncbi:MAG: DNA-3-methyladenine glycosylase I [Candidatus Lokiarchaeota archaeon]|nr:DNA-3-methyladenine glycosylase I [Candidatus Bathyarchaeota archaeon]MBY9013789.1 DNA-3-methyladenine glycosylase I [Candidatus Lokiarchaeota archaeon]